MARFDASQPEPLWISAACTRLYAAALAGDAIAVYCGSGAVPPAPFPPGALVVLDAATGRERGRFPLPATSPWDEHRVIAAHGLLAIRAGTHLVLADATPAQRATRELPDSFGLAATEHGIAYMDNGSGLVELEAATGRELRRIALPVRGRPDPFTTRLGELVVQGDAAYLEAAGEVHALSLASGALAWHKPGEFMVPDGDRVHTCRGNHYVALDARNGAVVYAYSTGTCRVVGVAGPRVLVRFEALPDRSAGADQVWSGVLAFERRPGPPAPCERATVQGEVRLDGAPAPGLAVRAGTQWFTETNGVVHLSGGPMTPDNEAPAATTRTDSRGRYSLTLCERGHVPILVNPEEARARAAQPEVDDFRAFVHLAGRGSYTVDFALRAHGPTL